MLNSEVPVEANQLDRELTSEKGSSQPSIIVSSDVCKTVVLDGGRELQILKGISFEIKRGESVAIVGRSGSGKTTLLGLLAGLDVASAGSVRLMGQALESLDEDRRADLRAEHVGFVFQSFHLLPTLNALENVMMPLELFGHKGARAEAQQILHSLGLGDRQGHFPAQMSGGEQQRVALARAFACQPDILFADEPTGNLDTRTGEQIIQALFERNQAQGTTLVIVTHDIALARRCDQVIEIEDGCVKPSGSDAPDVDATLIDAEAV